MNPSTRTATITADVEHGPLSLSLNLPNFEASLADKVETLVEKMMACGLFSADALNKWIDAFNQSEMATEDGKQTAAFLLCELLFEQIRPAYLKTVLELEKQDHLLTCEELLKKAIQLLIPNTMTVQQFLDDYDKFADEEPGFRAELKAASDDINALASDLFKAANKSNQGIMDDFKAQKQLLLDRNEDRKAATKKLANGLNSAGAKVELINASLLTKAEAVQRLAEQQTQQEAVLQQLLEQGNRILERL